MGKKTKTGKARKDKFYQLAKETGYRSRAAFKLLQLNRKYQFLPSSRVVIDLCAAPGGWLQVAAQNTPVSSHCIGIDLVPIRAIPNCITLTEDITTDKCRQMIRKELQTWKADCVLNDGAPNVGKNWLHDAYAQAELTLQALRLATDFLRKGGWFVTKVFRSKDYNALLWVFKQLFKKVFATKPKASRNESAEVFVVCQNYLAPDKIDPKFLDPKSIFKEVDGGPVGEINLLHPDKKKKKAEGYAEGDYTCYHPLSARKFLEASNHVEILATASEIVLDDPFVLSHKRTTAEIKECCRDIKVLGKKDIRSILTWHKKLKEELFSDKDGKKSAEEAKSEDEELDEDELIDKKLTELKAEELHDQKKKTKKIRREKSKLRHKMDMQMIIPGDRHDMSEDLSLFNLEKIKGKNGLSKIEEGDMPTIEDDESDDDNAILRRKHQQAYDRHTENKNIDDLSDYDDEDDDLDMVEYDGEDGGEAENNDIDDNEEESEPIENPLMIQLEAKDIRAQRKTALWFKKDIFSGLDEERDEDLEIGSMAENLQNKGSVILTKEHEGKVNKPGKISVKNGAKNADLDDNVEKPIFEGFDSGLDSDASEGSDYIMSDLMTDQNSKRKNSGVTHNNKDGFEIVAMESHASKIRKLDPESLAIGAAMVQSGKRRREITDSAYNRFTTNDENLPDWFVEDEAKHMQPMLPVSKEEMAEYKERLKAINARPVKKVAEAQGRKKRRSVKKLEKARKKAEVVSETVDITDKEKWQQIKQIYKRAGLLKKKKEDVTYVVAKKSGAGKRVSRPAGVQGRFKVVDPRMKKDSRNSNASSKKNGGRGKADFKGKNKKKR